MKKLFYLVIFGAGIIGCSTEPIETEVLESIDAKVKTQEADKSMMLAEAEICYGDAPVFVFDFPQDNKGNGDAKDTDVHLQVWNPEIEDWESFQQLTYQGAGPEEYAFEEEALDLGTYEFRAKIGSGGFNYSATLEVIDCSDCEESFSYLDNEDGSYTFTYIPEEDMENAEVVFTFAQGVTVDGLEGWGSNGVTLQSNLNFEACVEYSWTVELDPRCNGKGQSTPNLWTDFKINDISKKNDETPTIEGICN
ncbi:hypothetical protein [Salegentibacter sp.]|uniref:hypothetical protein n=1 Tax=Salegentibacter sp. TaxID=1903072 RepID=UPI003561CFC5